MTCFLLIESHKSDFNPITGIVVCTRCQTMSTATLSLPDILVEKLWVHIPIYNSQNPTQNSSGTSNLQIYITEAMN